MRGTVLSVTTLSATTSSFADVVRSRHSVRRFLPYPLSPSVIRGVLQDAQAAPSNCNTQPWTVHVVSGAARDALSTELLKADKEERFSFDFTFDYADFGQGAYLDRAHDHAATLYGALEIPRSDREGRKAHALENLKFHGAPHVALLFMPVFGDGVRVAGDIGMYAQNFLLSLTARGLGGIPQTMLGMYADTVREVLGVPAELKLLFGISFGAADLEARENSFRLGRVPLEHSVVLHDTPGVFDQ
ncbi:nitroreductase [Lentzea flaviverrucosa]|uniref:Nitroreductase n=1 Tax=Lentzea flaviverrucosa TaxID=200379 RepID=A0A1H9XSJ6_9PSEU|nr:nitroreductase [Lentzea flaviverrucosa]RDI19293.1 nitroreductase [Lentzea flaviverrucosa]SES49132.1 Nitroreductase [Lentzea flaviverrucosa]